MLFTLRHRTLPAVVETSSAHDHAVILLDGTCAFCEGAVNFIARRDPAGYFKYGASQSPTAAALLAPYGIDRETARSIVLIEAGQVYLRSTASLRIARPAVSVESRWRVAGRPTPTAGRGLPRRRGRTPAAGRVIKCVRGAPARDPPAARVAHRGGDPVGHGVLHRRRGARRGLCEDRRRGRIGRRHGDHKMIQKGTYGSSFRLRCDPFQEGNIAPERPQRQGGRCATSAPLPGPQIDDLGGGRSGLFGWPRA